MNVAVELMARGLEGWSWSVVDDVLTLRLELESVPVGVAGEVVLSGCEPEDVFAAALRLDTLMGGMRR